MNHTTIEAGSGQHLAINESNAVMLHTA